MPWRGLKAGLANRDARSRSPAVDSQLPRHSDQLPRIRGSSENLPSPLSHEVQLAQDGNEEGEQDSAALDSPNGEHELKLRPARTHGTPRHHRFSLLRFRHASDPQLSTSYAASEPPPVPSIPRKFVHALNGPRLTYFALQLPR